MIKTTAPRKNSFSYLVFALALCTISFNLVTQSVFAQNLTVPFNNLETRALEKRSLPRKSKVGLIKQNASDSANNNSTEKSKIFGTKQIAGSPSSPTACTTLGIVPGQTVNGTLDNSDCVYTDGTLYDAYTFNGTAGQQIAISLDSTDFDPFLLLYKGNYPGGTGIAENADSNGTNNARIPQDSGYYTLTSTGTYTILADATNAGQSGNYTLMLSDSGVTTACSAMTISIGQTVNGTLQAGDCIYSSDGSYYDAYTFSGTAGQQIFITMNSSQFDAYLLLFQGIYPNGDNLAEDDDSGGGTNARIPGSGFFTLPSTGTYTILANAYSAGETGSYTLVLGPTSNSSGMGYEADVAPRFTGDNQIQSNDVVQVQRFLNELDTPNIEPNEFQRADSAPRTLPGDPNTLVLGNGVIDSADVVQAQRYLNELDPLTPAGGPVSPTTAPLQSQSKAFDAAAALGNGLAKDKSETTSAPSVPATDTLRVESTAGSAGSQVSVNIRVDPIGNEAQFAFALLFDPAVLSYTSFAAGDTTSTSYTCNATTTAGRIRCSIGSFTGNLAGTNPAIGEISPTPNQVLIRVIFTIAPTATPGTVTPLTFGSPSASDEAANSITPTTVPGAVTVAATDTLRVESTAGSAGSQVSVNIRVDPIGNEAQFAFALLFDPAVLSYTSFAAGDTTSTSYTCNATTTAGRIRCSIGSFTGNLAGTNPAIGEISPTPNQVLIRVIFTIAPTATPGTVTPLTFGSPSASDEAANSITPTTVPGAVTVLAPTLATVTLGGQVTSAAGRGIRNVVVTMTDSDGNKRTATTSSFGFYQFDNVTAGRVYFFSVKAKHYTFTEQNKVMNVNGEINDINFVGYIESKQTITGS